MDTSIKIVRYILVLVFISGCSVFRKAKDVKISSKEVKVEEVVLTRNHLEEVSTVKVEDTGRVVIIHLSGPQKVSVADVLSGQVEVEKIEVHDKRETRKEEKVIQASNTQEARKEEHIVEHKQEIKENTKVSISMWWWLLLLIPVGVLWTWRKYRKYMI